MTTKQLYAHQEKAIQRVLDTDFETSVIQYATGTGKSIIGFEIISKYHINNPRKNILWVCEHKFVIQQQFSGEYIFPKTLKINNYSNEKQQNWQDLVNSSYHMWKFTQLIVINRAFLTSNDNYKKLKIPIGLVIHDECHTSSNNTSQLFYKWLYDIYPEVKCIGLSATPNWQYPFDKLCIKYDIIEAIIDNIICHPIIYSLKYASRISFENIFDIICVLLSDNNAKRKIVIWCGTIDNCINTIESWKNYIQVSNKYGWEKNMVLMEDHSRVKEKQNVISTFNQLDGNVILFCANKHREASDFKDLDGCVFLDGVQIREEKLFVQCLGRVLRKNVHKTHGWIFDTHATNTVDLSERLLKFTEKNYNWKCVTVNETISDTLLNKIYIDIISDNIIKNDVLGPLISETVSYNLNANNITQHFVREIPPDREYIVRINEEIRLMDIKNVFKYIEYAKKIQSLSEDTIYITRGSCGSSLVCYLLGITHVDPIKYNISFERFLHDERDTLPDIDFDFPYNRRNEIFMRMSMEWGEEISRISSKITWQERSATREAIRLLGNNKQMNNTQLNQYLKTLSPSQNKFIEDTKHNLLGKQRTTMKHVGGVVFGYQNNLKKNTQINITTDDKHDISATKTFKIDILSSRSLAIIQECQPSFNNKHITNIDEYSNIYERIFGNGLNMGLVLAESVLMKRAFMRYKPKNIEQLAWCFAIVRPMAKVARDSVYVDTQDDLSSSDIPTIVYDDDVITYIKYIMNVPICEADNIRRKIAKGDMPTMQNLMQNIVNKFKADNPVINQAKYSQYIESSVRLITRLTQYGFCKAHSISYAMMIWHLAKLKYERPQQFWSACLSHADSSYAKWVHLSEAVYVGVDIRKHMELTNQTKSVYSQIRNKNVRDTMNKLTETQQLLHYGFWAGLEDGNYFDNCYLEPIVNTNKYKFRGILAAIRTPRSYQEKKQSGLYLGVGFQKYLDIIVKNLTHFDTKKYIGLEGICTIYCEEENIYISETYKLF